MLFVLLGAAVHLTSAVVERPGNGHTPAEGPGQGQRPCDPSGASRLLPGRHQFTITSGGMNRSFAVFIPFQATNHSPSITNYNSN